MKLLFLLVPMVLVLLEAAGCADARFTCERGGLVGDGEALATLATCAVVQGDVHFALGAALVGHTPRAPALRVVEGDVYVTGAASWDAAALFPRLARVDGALTFYDARHLTAVALPHLASAGALTIRNNVDVVTLDVPALRTVGGFAVRANPHLAGVTLSDTMFAESVRFTCNGSVDDAAALAASFARQMPASAVPSGNRLVEARGDCTP